jgi:hypothetical protein
VTTRAKAAPMIPDTARAPREQEIRHMDKRLEAAQARLAAIRVEQQRQMSFAGERLGVFARLKELARDERQQMRKIERFEQQRGKAHA